VALPLFLKKKKVKLRLYVYLEGVFEVFPFFKIKKGNKINTIKVRLKDILD
jgi:hypothetical protein